MPARCSKCSRSFATKQARDQHLNSSVHRPSYHCNDCNRKFVNQNALNQHLNSSIHSPSHRCSKCDRWFWTAESLHQHRVNSPAHAQRTKCLGVGCQRKFGSWSAMIQHWESGGCRAGITRSFVNSVAVAIDTNHLFTVGGGQMELLLEDSRPRVVEVQDGDDLEIAEGDAGAPTAVSNSSVASSISILTPNTEASALQTPGTVIFTPGTPLPGNNIGNGVSPFILTERLEQLNQRIRIIEIPPTYFCPVPGCRANKTFASLGSLFQHLERGCRGSPREFQRRMIRSLPEHF